MNNVHVLYAEDDAVQAAIVVGTLEDEGFNVTRVANGYAVLENIVTANFDIVLTDYRMPKMDGLTLIKALEAKKIGVPSVILTVANDVSLAFTALEAGATDFVLKDPDGHYLDILASVLQRALEKHRLKLRMQQLTDQLQEQRKLSHQALDSMNEGVALVDKNNELQYANNQLRRLLLGSKRLIGGEQVSDLAIALANHGSVQGLTKQQDIYPLLRKMMSGERQALEYTLDDKTVYQIRSTALADGGVVLTFLDITLQKQQTQALVRTVEWAPVAMIGVDKSQRVVMANQEICFLTGYSKEELRGMPLNKLIPGEYRPQHDGLVNKYFRNLKPGPMRGGVDLKILCKDGREVPVAISLSGIEVMNETRVLASVVDISARKEAEQAIRRAHDMTQAIIDNSPFTIMATDDAGTIVAASPAIEALLGYRKDEIIGKVSPIRFHLSVELEQRAAALSEKLGRSVLPGFQVLIAQAEQGVVEGVEYTYLRKDGRKVPVNLTVTTLRAGQGLPSGYLFVAYDITKQKDAQQQMKYIAQHDQLTGLPNRVLMEDRLRMALARVKRYGNKLGVLLLDLDGFKVVNDSLGHLAGDQLLQTVAERMRSCVRNSDTVARLGGDEFVFILPDINAGVEVEKICEKLIAAVAEPINIGEQSVQVTASIGFCLAPDSGDTINELVKNADSAMYSAKQTGKNVYRSFIHKGDGLQTPARLTIENAFIEALEHEQLSIVAKPVFELTNNSLIGYRLQSGWNKSSYGEIGHERIVSLAESTGQLKNYSQWFVKAAAAELRSQDQTVKRIIMPVVLRQLEQKDFVQNMESILTNAGFELHQIDIEISEKELQSVSSLVEEVLKSLVDKGARISLESFSMNMQMIRNLTRFPVYSIKVDSRYLDNSNLGNQAIIKALVVILAQFELGLVIDSVTDRGQLEALKICCADCQNSSYMWESDMQKKANLEGPH